MIIRLAVDIDETLGRTNLLWAEHHINTYGSPEGLNAEEIIKKYRFVKNVPYWQFDDAHNWIEHHINSNESKLEIPVIEDAVSIMQRIPVACYLTTRPEHTITGTKEWLMKQGFPNKEIFSSAKGLEWKAQKLSSMYPYITGLIDDSLDLIKYLPSNYKGNLFLYSHSYYPSSKLHIIPCPTWTNIDEEIQKLM